MRWPRSLPARELLDGGLDVRRHSFRVPEGSARRIGAATAANPLVLADVVRQVRADRAQLIHVQCVSHGAWFAYRTARILRLPIVVSLQGELTMDADDIYGRSPLLRHTLRLLLAKADAVTACSHAVLNEAQAWAGIELGSRGTVVYNGVDVDELQSEVRHSGSVRAIPKPFILGIGRHVEQKGFDVLIKAFSALVLDPAFDWDLVVAGDGPVHEALVKQARELALGDRVHFVGRADRQEAVALFQGAAAFALPSRHEPFGIVNLEAMAAGIPVVASEVGGVPEFVIDGSSGLLVPPDDPAALAAAIRRLFDSPALRESLVTKGVEVANEFRWDCIEHEYRCVYGMARARYPRSLRGPGDVDSAGTTTLEP
jgi:glycogen(starch) synthase